MESKRLDNAALAAGISPNYINAHGKPQSISAETKRRLLDAMHQRTATKVAVTPVPNVMVYTSGKKMPMVVEGSGPMAAGGVDASAESMSPNIFSVTTTSN